MKPRAYPRVVAALYGTPWAILESKFDEIEAAMMTIIANRSVDGWTAFDDEYEEDEGPKSQILGDTMVMPIQGTITPRPSAFSSGGTSTAQIEKMVDNAMSPKVKSVVIDINSPGGSVHGVEEAGLKIRQLAAMKPVHAVANHSAASAALWLGSQATTLSVSPSGEVGSIGVAYRRVDVSAAMEKAGVKVDYITSGKYKAEGASDRPMTDDERSHREAVSAAYYDKFIRAVAAGRKRPEAQVRDQWATGRMFLAEEAVAMGLADRVATFEQVLHEARAASARSRTAAATRISASMA